MPSGTHPGEQLYLEVSGLVHPDPADGQAAGDEGWAAR
jgi:hypothetical protein